MILFSFFQDRGSPNKFYDLPNSFLALKFKVKNADDSSLTGTTDLAALNLFAATSFQELTLFFNDTVVSTCVNYPYTSYLRSLLGYSIDYKNNQLLSSVYSFDEQGSLTDLNSSYKTRKDIIAESKLVEAIVPFFSDAFQIQKYIYGDINFKLQLKRTAPEFCLVSGVAQKAKFKIIFEECVLMLKKIEVSPPILSIHSRLYDKQELFYNYNKTLIRTCSFAKGSINSTVSNIFNTQTLPELLVLTLVKTDEYHGKLNANPFNFKRNGLTSLQVQVNNQVSDFTSVSVSDTEYLGAYEGMIRNLGLGQTSIGISKNNWKAGNAVYVFKLYPSEEQSHLSIHFTFGEGASDNLTGIILGQAKATLNIGSNNTSVISELS